MTNYIIAELVYTGGYRGADGSEDEEEGGDEFCQIRTAGGGRHPDRESASVGGSGSHLRCPFLYD